MGDTGDYHWLVVLLVFLVPVALVVFLITRAALRSRSGEDAGVAFGGTVPGVGRSARQADLAEVDRLKAHGAITEEQYQQRRSAILARR